MGQLHDSNTGAEFATTVTNDTLKSAETYVRGHQERQARAELEYAEIESRTIEAESKHAEEEERKEREKSEKEELVTNEESSDIKGGTSEKTEEAKEWNVRDLFDVPDEDAMKDEESRSAG